MELTVHRPSPLVLGAGSLEEQPLVDLLEIVTYAPQPLLVLIDEPTGEEGRVVVQGGEVLFAITGEQSGREALSSLAARRQGRWRVVRASAEVLASARTSPDPGLPLSELAAELGPRTEGERLISEGALSLVRPEQSDLVDTFGVLELVSLLGHSAQQVEIVVTSHDVPVAWLTVRSGEVLDLRSANPAPSPQATLRTVLASHHDGYAAYRRASPELAQPGISPPLPIHTLAEITRTAVRAPLPIVPFGAPGEEDTSDPPTYTPDPSAPKPPMPTGPRVVQPGLARRTPAPASPREPGRGPKPTERASRGQPPSTAQELSTIASQLDVIQYRLSASQQARGGQDDQELRISLAGLREELARQGAQLESLAKEPAVARWVITSMLQLAMLLAVVVLLALAWLP